MVKMNDFITFTRKSKDANNNVIKVLIIKLDQWFATSSFKRAKKNNMKWKFIKRAICLNLSVALVQTFL